MAAPLLKDFEYLKQSSEPNLIFGYAFLLYHSRRYAQAADQFCRLSDDRQWRVWAHNLAGLCHYYLDQPEPGMHHFDRALDTIPPDRRFEYREVYFNRACLL